MYRAMLAKGFHVDLVQGTARERKASIAKVRNKIESGERYNFVYVENNNKPNTLTGGFPYLNSLLTEWLFFRFLKKHRIKIGLYYRDIYWRFEVFKSMLPWYIRYPVLPLYYYDLLVYRSYVDHVFLPNAKLSESFPVSIKAPVSELPPGAEINARKPRPTENVRLELLYAGGVEPPLYDLGLMTQSISGLPNVHMRFCLREREWRNWSGHYTLPANASVRHLDSDEMESEFHEADVFLDYRPRHDYLDLCFPVKIMDALGHELPVIVRSGTRVAKFVLDTGFGWIVSSPAELTGLLEELTSDRGRIREKQDLIRGNIKNHLWSCRVDQIIQKLDRV